MNNSGWNMYVFRNGRQLASGSALIARLRQALKQWECASEQEGEDSVVAALIAAGELECALLDDVNAMSCSIASEITDALACDFLRGDRLAFPSILQKVEQLRVAPNYEVAVQEGFAYYALHPRKVAMLLEDLAVPPRMAVLGIRSIGVTLSAVAKAALLLRGVPCTRITVRPTGHPYNRVLELTPELCDWVRKAGDAGFLVLDEGPGISGSSFLSVAEALTSCGVEAERIQMIGSRQVDPATLRADHASERWSRFQFHVMQNAPIPPPVTGESLSGGIWRRYFQCEDENDMPASWAPLEPAKFLSYDEQSIFKFEGFGHYGQEIRRNANLLADYGFSPRSLGHSFGFGQYELMRGRTLTIRDLSPEVLARMVDYLVLRSTEFTSVTPQTPELEKMLRWNWQVEFGEELCDKESRLATARVVVCDGRMGPSKWLRTNTGSLLKVDACKHGDDHFFPGPCDIAWDVAGVIVEWRLPRELQENIVQQYEMRSGDAISERLAPYTLAYATFRMGWSKMAALAMQGEYDEGLLTRDYERYRAFALTLRQQRDSANLMTATADPSSHSS